MATEKERLRALNDKERLDSGDYVLYWMQQSQRADFNPALDYAIDSANELDLPVIVCFGLTDDYPEANLRHFQFMLEGLAETAQSLRDRGVKLVVRKGSPPLVARQLATSAAVIVCDVGYLRHQRQWRNDLASAAVQRVEQVEGDVVVPTALVSSKAEYAARTIRPKIKGHWQQFITARTKKQVERSSLSLSFSNEIDVSDPAAALDCLDIDAKVGAVSRFRGGLSEARKLLTKFIRGDLEGYHDARNDPSAPQCSTLSPYLHFGQISPVEVALKVQQAKSGSSADNDAFLEELIVRRELAINYVKHEADYDKYSALPEWARKTLGAHRDDSRPERYTRSQLEAAQTHDDYWNAAMTEMVKTGYMHNYMRMYWGKKIIEWCNTPEYAYSTTLYLNNKYFLDGRDANSYANVGWLFGLHDRAWSERDVFGKVRYMNARGLERKFDIDAYVQWVNQL